MPFRTPRVELAEIRSQQRSLRQREVELLANLRGDIGLEDDFHPVPRPGWPIIRLDLARAN
jgi:hypothetical protein